MHQSNLLNQTTDFKGRKIATQENGWVNWFAVNILWLKERMHKRTKWMNAHKMCQAVCNTISICLFSCKSTHLMLISGSSKCVFFCVGGTWCDSIIAKFLCIGFRFLKFFFCFLHDLRFHLSIGCVSVYVCMKIERQVRW